jgi:uncharacterized protein (TIGR02147 family)
LITVFNFKDYKSYLKKLLAPSGESRGMRTGLAETLGCNIGFISQVLGGESNFSLEHAIGVADYIKITGQERDYFLILVHYEKAGSKKLKEYYQKQIDEILTKRAEIKSRVHASKSLDEKDYLIYYGQWYYCAIHMLLSISEYQTKLAVSEKLGISLKQVEDAITFLVEKKLVIEEKGRFKTGPTRIHLGKTSPLITQHHTNWRMEAIKSLSNQNDTDLHYSSVLTMSNSDAKKIRDVLLKALEDVEIILKPSPDEEIYSLNMDMFTIGKND